jgi:hypothetical protein
LIYLPTNSFTRKTLFHSIKITDLMRLRRVLKFRGLLKNGIELIISVLLIDYCSVSKAPAYGVKYLDRL